MMTVENLTHQLEKLKEDHRALGAEIDRMMEIPLYDQLAAQRLKKRKLQLKDQILKLQKKLLPDIIA